MDVIELARKAESGNVAAQSILGICYLDGIDVDVDYRKAFQLLSAAAERGAARAKANLGRMYAEGLGVNRDLSKAVPLFEAAAEAGEFQAQIALARLRAQGIGGQSDPIAARRWYSGSGCYRRAGSRTAKSSARQRTT